ncbi:MAG TPA: hypothetical protein VN495_02810 [Candidatus Paceibacterota bacterium]|nr:hypothetical protein [Candidatus Paceibacterota bacterium]
MSARRLFPHFTYENKGDYRYNITARLPANHGGKALIVFQMGYQIMLGENEPNRIESLTMVTRYYHLSTGEAVPIVCNEEARALLVDVMTYFDETRAFLEKNKTEAPHYAGDTLLQLVAEP